MRASWLGSHRIDLRVCESTNDEAARLARAGAHHGTIVIADAQTAGRGRDGRAWASPDAVGLYFSAIVRPAIALAAAPPMTLAIGIGVCDAVRACGVAGAVLKWPNDVLVSGRKLAGVLVETQSQGARLDAAIVGIGVNLTGEPLPTAISLAAAGAHVVAREPFVAALCAHVEHWIDRYVASGMPAIVPAWQARMAPNLYARAASVTGQVAGLDPGDGALLLRDANGHVHRVRSGDVEVLRDGGML